MNEKMTYNKLAWLSLLSLFLLGFAVGFAVDRLAFSEKDKHARSNSHNDSYLVEKFTKDLVLTKDQRDSLVVYLGKLRRQHSELRKTVDPEFQHIREDFRKLPSGAASRDLVASRACGRGAARRQVSGLSARACGERCRHASRPGSLP